MSNLLLESVDNKNVATQEYVDSKNNAMRDQLTGELTNTELIAYTALAQGSTGILMDRIYGLMIKYYFRTCSTTVPLHTEH